MLVGRAIGTAFAQVKRQLRHRPVEQQEDTASVDLILALLFLVGLALTRNTSLGQSDGASLSKCLDFLARTGLKGASAEFLHDTANFFIRLSFVFHNEQRADRHRLVGRND